MTAWQSHYFERDGVRLRYLRAGVGRPLLLLHGITDNAAYWGATGRALTAHFNVIALDQRAHGESDAPAGGYRIADYVADAAALLDALTPAEPAFVIGHSFGGWVGSRLAAQHPDQVRALALEDPPFREFTDPPAPRSAEEDKNRLAWFQWLIDLTGKTPDEILPQARAEHPTWSEEDCRHWAVSKTQVGARLYQPDGVEFDLRWHEAAQLVRCPTLLIHGDGDLGSIVDTAGAARIVALMPDCRAVRIAGAGHAIHRDQPAAMLAALHEFLGAPRQIRALDV
jgi:pimeloyl-ACP methyl ester carboxylesterase